MVFIPKTLLPVAVCLITLCLIDSISGHPSFSFYGPLNRPDRNGRQFQRFGRRFQSGFGFSRFGRQENNFAIATPSTSYGVPLAEPVAFDEPQKPEVTPRFDDSNDSDNSNPNDVNSFETRTSSDVDGFSDPTLNVEVETNLSQNVITKSESGNVLEIAIRKVTADQEEFEQARANFINLLTQEAGVIADAEFEAVSTLDKSLMLAEPEDRVFVGMTQYESMDAFNRIQEKLGDSEELKAFFNTFEVLCFKVVEGVDGTEIDLENFPFDPKRIEIAVRNVKSGRLLEFDETRRTFIDFLNESPGVEESSEYQATDDPNSRIGMTFYSDMNAVETFAQNQFNHDITPVYYDTFDIDCYFILQRIDSRPLEPSFPVENLADVNFTPFFEK